MVARTPPRRFLSHGYWLYALILIRLQHALRGEERPVQRDRVTHDIDEPAAIPVEERQDVSLELVVGACGVLSHTSAPAVTRPPIARS
jgi:hypothetical protein